MLKWLMVSKCEISLKTNGPKIWNFSKDEILQKEKFPKNKCHKRCNITKDTKDEIGDRRYVTQNEMLDNNKCHKRWNVSNYEM